MTKFFILALMLTANLSFANTMGYNCTVMNPSDATKIEALDLPGYLPEVGVLTVAPELCGLPTIMIYRDSCDIKGHTLIIGLNDDESMLVTKKGKKFDLVCEDNTEVYPQPSHGGGN